MAYTNLHIFPFTGSHKYGTDVHPFTSLAFFGNCVSTNPPRCTAILLNDLDWNIHHGEEYYITIRVNSSLGLTAKVSSKPYKHEILKPSAGVVIDTDPRKSDVVCNIHHKIFSKINEGFILIVSFLLLSL